MNLDYIWQQRFRIPEYVIVSQYHQTEVSIYVLDRNVRHPLVNDLLRPRQMPVFIIYPGPRCVEDVPNALVQAHFVGERISHVGIQQGVVRVP